jgi:hypothetical protein
MTSINYDGRVFGMLSSTTGDAEAIASTRFVYHQTDNIVTCEYGGGSVKVGRMIALVDEDGGLTLRFEHIYTDGRMMSGKGTAIPEVLPDGRLRLHETYEVFDTGYQGTSAVEEIAAENPE